MPAPKRANTAAATEAAALAARQRRLAALVAELREAGYTVAEPSEPMTVEQANGGHCTRGGTIASGQAVCQCGDWDSADYPNPAARKLARQLHLAQVHDRRVDG